MKSRLGALAGQLSGSLGAIVAGHNRYGTYFRNRSIPVKVTSEAAAAAKARFRTVTRAYQLVDAGSKLGWGTWAVNNPVADVFGAASPLTGHAAYVKLNSRMLLLDKALISAPPVIAAPSALTSITLTADIGAGGVKVAFTPTPVAAGFGLWVWAAVVESSGVKYVQNLLRMIGTWEAAASPMDIKSYVEGRFGTLIIGQTLHVMVHKISLTDGQVSGSLRDSALVVST